MFAMGGECHFIRHSTILPSLFQSHRRRVSLHLNHVLQRYSSSFPAKRRLWSFHPTMEGVHNMSAYPTSRTFHFLPPLIVMPIY